MSLDKKNNNNTSPHLFDECVMFEQGRRGSNTDSDHHMKRSQSVSQQLGGKPSSDLLGLNLFNPSSTPSSASTPTGSHPYAPLQSPPPLSTSPTPSQPPPPQSAPPTHSHTRFPIGKSYQGVYPLAEWQEDTNFLSRVNKSGFAELVTLNNSRIYLL